MKTKFLAQDSTWIDPMSRSIKAFSIREFEENHWRSRLYFSLFYQWNLTLKHSLDVEMSLEAKESKRFKDFGV